MALKSQNGLLSAKNEPNKKMNRTNQTEWPKSEHKCVRFAKPNVPFSDVYCNIKFRSGHFLPGSCQNWKTWMEKKITKLKIDWHIQIQIKTFRPLFLSLTSLKYKKDCLQQSTKLDSNNYHLFIFDSYQNWLTKLNVGTA